MSEMCLWNLFFGFKLVCTFLLILFIINLCSCANFNASDHAKLLSLSPSSTNEQQKFACSQTTYVYNALSSTKGLPKLDSSKFPQTAINGDHLKICAQGFTCCTEEMESRLVDESRKEYQKYVQDKIVGLSHTFESRTTKFDRFFRELLSNSRQDLHKMFLRTYGMLYEQNSDIFKSLFDDLTSYYIGNQKIDLDQSVDKFYQQLYRRMFRILNQAYQFDSAYWDCMTRHMEELKPFGDVPVKMKQQVTRAFVAARTFVSGLSTGRDVVRQIMELPPSGECNSALMRMMYCPHCRGMTDVKPCNNFCLNVMKGCLAYQTELDNEWNEYLDALMQLLERLEGPFNIESVIDPIDVKISEAIMTFQDRGKEITDKIFAGCGNPKMNRKRSLKKGEITLTDLKFGNPAPPAARPTTAAGTSLDRLAKDIREKITLAKGFWRNLPYVLCNDEKVSAPARPDDANCWNGLSKDKYATGSVGDGLVNQMNNPEVTLPLGSTNNNNISVGDQTIKLRMASSKLRRAFNGQNVDFKISPSPSSSAPAMDVNTQDDGDSETSGEFSGDDNNDNEDGVRRKSGKSSAKKPSKLETDDEDLLNEASGDDSFSGAEPPPNSRVGKPKIFFKPSFSSSTSTPTTTVVSTTVEETEAEEELGENTHVTTTAFFPDTNFDVHEIDVPKSTSIQSTTTTASTTRSKLTPPAPLPSTTIGRWVPPTSKPPVYVVFDIKTEKPTSKKGAGAQTALPKMHVIFVLLLLLTILSKRILSSS